MWDLKKPEEPKYVKKGRGDDEYNAQLMADQFEKDFADSILKAKADCTIDQLCEGQPVQFKQYMEYVRGLKFHQKPNYKQLKSLFEGLFREMEYQEDG